MAIASDSFAGVDLSRLPSPNVIEGLDFDSLFASNLAQFQVYFPDFDATVESDPVVKIIELFTYRELILRQRVNDVAKGVMVAYATGSDLDQLAALFEVERYILTPADPVTGMAAVLEGDGDFRRRLVLAPEGYSVAGPEGAYIYHALEASSDVLDASAYSPKSDDIKTRVLALLQASNVGADVVASMQAMLDSAVWPGTVVTTVLSRTGNGSAPQATLDAVAAKVSADTTRPLTDHVTVQSAQIVPFEIEAVLTFFAGPDSGIVLSAARDRLDTYLGESLKLGRDITRANIIAALCPNGVQNVELVSPPADIVINRQQAGHCTGITITNGGVGE